MPVTVVVGLWLAAWTAPMLRGDGQAWHFFSRGGQLLVAGGHSGGLHLYAQHPILQFGPVPVLVAEVLRLLLPHANMQVFVVQALGVVAGVVMVAVVRGRTPSARDGAWTARRRALLAACIAAPSWLYLSVHSTHIDDVGALLAGVLGWYAVVRRRPVWAGLALGLAVDSKPWAVPFLALLLALPDWRGRWRAAATATIVIALAWAPFVLGDTHTLTALSHYTIAITPRSALRVLGVHGASTPPWDRSAQLLLGLALGALAVRRHRTEAVLLIAMAARIALEPGTNRYYTAGLAVGALLVDLLGTRSRWPWWSTAVLVLLTVPRYHHVDGTMYGIVTLVFCVATLGLLVVPRPRAGPDADRAATLPPVSLEPVGVEPVEAPTG